MLKYIISTIFLFSITNTVHSATVEIAFPNSGRLADPNELQLNHFTTLSTNGEVAFNYPIVGETTGSITSAGASVFFEFDTSLVTVSQIALNGWSDDTPVFINALDIDGNSVFTQSTTGYWAYEILVSNVGSIAYLEVELPFSELSYMNISYQPVPIPPAIWLFSSGILFLSLISRRKPSIELVSRH